jgi:SAM-dependent methyltransferase
MTAPQPLPAVPPLAPQDAIGATTLERLAAARKYNRWLTDRLQGWVGRRVLEIGAGLGSMSEFILDREHVVLSDTDPYYLARLRQRFGGLPRVRIAELRLPAGDSALAAERLDTLICLNVLEHVADDVGSLAAMRPLVAPGGRLVLLVPSLPSIYGTLDEALGHVRRYTPTELRGKYRRTGWRMVHLEYFNLAGVPGWWFTGRVLKRRLIPASSLGLYDALVPLFRLERFLPWRVGQSLIAIGERAP